MCWSFRGRKVDDGNKAGRILVSKLKWSGITQGGGTGQVMIFLEGENNPTEARLDLPIEVRRLAVSPGHGCTATPRT